MWSRCDLRSVGYSYSAPFGTLHCQSNSGCSHGQSQLRQSSPTREILESTRTCPSCSHTTRFRSTCPGTEKASQSSRGLRTRPQHRTRTCLECCRRRYRSKRSGRRWLRVWGRGVKAAARKKEWVGWLMARRLVPRCQGRVRLRWQFVGRVFGTEHSIPWMIG